MTIIEIMNKIRNEAPKIMEEIYNTQSFKDLVRDELLRYGEPKAEFRCVDGMGILFKVTVRKFGEKCYFIVEANGKCKEVLEV